MLPSLNHWISAYGLLFSFLQPGQRAAPEPVEITRSGHIAADDAQSYSYESFDVPEGTSSIHVSQWYSDNGSGNRLDMGIWDQRGHDLALSGNYTTGFRGWSKNVRSEFTITPESATPGYIAGPIEPGSWAVGMGAQYTVDGGIDYEYTITLSFEPVSSYFEPSFAPSRVGQDSSQSTVSLDPDDPTPLESRRTWYSGDLHTHSTYSDGAQTPQDIVQGAQDANLSFFFSTEHNTQALNLVWGTMAPDDMLVAKGIEVTTMAGHWNALGLNWNQWVEFRYEDDEGLFPAVQNVQRHGGIASLNHPYIKGCYLCDWWYSDASYAEMDSIEVWNGRWATLNEEALELWQQLLVDGSVITAVGGSDSHDSSRLIGEPSTVVHATELSTPAIVDGIRASRVYLLRYTDVDIKVTVQDDSNQTLIAHVGDTVPRSSSSGSISAVLTTSGMPDDARAVFISDKGQFDEQSGPLSGDVRASIAEDTSFVRVEVRDSDDMMLALTNPIWIS